MDHNSNSRFMLIFNARCGSTWLMQLLNSRPGVWCEDEVFAPEHLDPQRQLASIRDFFTHPHEQTHVGFKLKVNDIADPQGLRTLADELGVRVLLLTRRNLVRRAISLYRGWALSERSGDWNLRDPDAERIGAVEIPAKNFVQRVEECIREDEALWDFGAGLSTAPVALWYEDLHASLPNEAIRIGLALGLERPYGFGEVEIRKHSPGSLDELVSNVGTLRSASEGKWWSWGFDY